MLFGYKLQIDLGDISEEKERLSSFIESKVKVSFTVSQNKLVSDSQIIKPEDLEKIVNKFIYQRKLNSTHWVSLEKNTVKINTFKGKDKKSKKQKKTSATTVSGPAQSWGL